MPTHLPRQTGVSTVETLAEGRRNCTRLELLRHPEQIPIDDDDHM